MNKEKIQVPEEKLEDVTGGGFSKDSKVMYYCPNPDCGWEIELDRNGRESELFRRTMAQHLHDYGGRTCKEKRYFVTPK